MKDWRVTQGVKYANVTTASQMLITIEITQHQALNLVASIASDFRSAIDFMPSDFRNATRSSSIPC